MAVFNETVDKIIRKILSLNGYSNSLNNEFAFALIGAEEGWQFELYSDISDVKVRFPYKNSTFEIDLEKAVLEILRNVKPPQTKTITYNPVNITIYKDDRSWIDKLKRNLHENHFGKQADQYIIDELVDIRRNDALDAVTYIQRANLFKNGIGFMKGETKTMKKYDIDFVAKKEEIEATYKKAIAEAQEAKELAMLEAEEIHDKAKLVEEKKAAAMALKMEYDSYIDAGFTPKQAEAFVMKTKDTLSIPIYPVTNV